MIRIKYMDNRRGQTLIETALIFILLMAILIGIAEFARAWYLKSSLKNAVRQGARVAVVTSGLDQSKTAACDDKAKCPPTASQDSDYIIQTVCCSIGVQNNANTTVTVSYTDDDSTGGSSPGDTVTVSATYTNSNFFIVGGPPWPWPKSLTYTMDAVMRYE